MRTITIQSSSFEKAFHQVFEILETEFEMRRKFVITLKSIEAIVNSHEPFNYIFEIGE